MKEERSSINSKGLVNQSSSCTSEEQTSEVKSLTFELYLKVFAAHFLLFFLITGFNSEWNSFSNPSEFFTGGIQTKRLGKTMVFGILALKISVVKLKKHNINLLHNTALTGNAICTSQDFLTDRVYNMKERSQEQYQSFYPKQLRRMQLLLCELEGLTVRGFAFCFLFLFFY